MERFIYKSFHFWMFSIFAGVKLNDAHTYVWISIFKCKYSRLSNETAAELAKKKHDAFFWFCINQFVLLNELLLVQICVLMVSNNANCFSLSCSNKCVLLCAHTHIYVYTTCSKSNQYQRTLLRVVEIMIIKLLFVVLVRNSDHT